MANYQALGNVCLAPLAHIPITACALPVHPYARFVLTPTRAQHALLDSTYKPISAWPLVPIIKSLTAPNVTSACLIAQSVT